VLPGALFNLSVDPAEICSLAFKADGLGGACDMRWLLFPYFKTSSSQSFIIKPNPYIYLLVRTDAVSGLLVYLYCTGVD